MRVAVHQAVLASLGHGLKCITPAITRPSDWPNDDLVALGFDFDLLTQPTAFQQRLRNANALRVSNADDFGSHEYNVITRSRAGQEHQPVARLPRSSETSEVFTHGAECVTLSGRETRPLRVDGASRRRRLKPPSIERYQRTDTITTRSEKTGIGGCVEGS